LLVIIQNHDDKVVQNQTYSLGHLSAFGAVLNGHGPQGSDIRVRVSYLSHVFSKTPEFGAISDFQDENDKNRVFCTDRYNCSLNISQYCADSIQNNVLTWESKDKNGASSYMVVKDVNGDDYAIIYRLTPSLSDEHDVEFIVKSAYHKTVIHKNPRKYNVRNLIKKCCYERKSLP
jgi:hypothetical protein